jgi:hypothetical protein
VKGKTIKVVEHEIGKDSLNKILKEIMGWRYS